MGGRHKAEAVRGKMTTFPQMAYTERMAGPFWFTAQSKCLDQALALWKEVLIKGQVPAVRCLQQTAASLQILAALYQLVAKVMGQCVDTDRRLSSFTFFGLCPSWEVMSPSVHSYHQPPQV